MWIFHSYVIGILSRTRSQVHFPFCYSQILQINVDKSINCLPIPTVVLHCYMKLCSLYISKPWMMSNILNATLVIFLKFFMIWFAVINNIIVVIIYLCWEIHHSIGNCWKYRLVPGYLSTLGLATHAY